MGGWEVRIRRIAIVMGRVVLPTFIVFAVTVHLLRPTIWHGRSFNDLAQDGDPLFMSYLVATILMSVLWVPLLLPVSSLHLVTNEKDAIRATTVLGTHRIQRRVRIHRLLRLPYGRSGTGQVWVVSGEKGLPVLLFLDAHTRPHMIMRALGQRIAPEPEMNWGYGVMGVLWILVGGLIAIGLIGLLLWTAAT